MQWSLLWCRSVAAALAVALVACEPPTDPSVGNDDDDGENSNDASVVVPADAMPVQPVDAATPLPPDASPLPTECPASFELSGYPDATSVWLSGDMVGWAATPAVGAVLMARGADGVWRADYSFQPGRYLYKFIVTTGTGVFWVHDETNPASEADGQGGFNSIFVCEGGGSSSVCGDPQAFDWRDAVMYFVMIDRFYDSDGMSNPVTGVSDGDARWGPSGQYEGGDLQGVRDQLGYLDDLGVSAIWLSAPFENRDEAGAAIDPANDTHTYSGYHGYWPSPDNISYANPDSPSPAPTVEGRVGTATDLHGVVDDAHGRGMKVMFDYVMNHVDLNSGLYAEQPEWFVYGDGCSPSNPCFATCGPGNLWNDPYWGTRCAFTDYLPPLDLYNNEARAWSVRDALWWAKEFGIDGLRLDAIKHVPLSWLTDLRAMLNAEVTGPGGRFYLVGETFDYDNRDLLKSFIHPDTMLDGQFDFPFKKRLCETVFRPEGNFDGFSGWMDGNDGFYNADPSASAIMTTWIGNHDVPRAIHFASGQIGNCIEGSYPGNGWNGAAFQQPTAPEPYERLGLAFAVMMLNPGIPLIYYGDEVGLAGGGDPDNRRMMPWDDTQLNAHQLALRARVAKLATIRKQYPVIGRGQRTVLQAGGDSWVYQMTGCGGDYQDVLVAMNKGDSDRAVTVPDGNYTDLMTDAGVDGGSVSVPARSVLVLVPR